MRHPILLATAAFGGLLAGAIFLQPALSTAQQPRQVVLHNRVEERFLLTVILRPDQTRTPQEIDERIAGTEFRKTFPPDDVKVVSWTAAPGLGEIIVIDLDVRDLRTVTRAVERAVWGAYSAEFHATYDILPLMEQERGKPFERPDYIRPLGR